MLGWHSTYNISSELYFVADFFYVADGLEAALCKLKHSFVNVNYFSNVLLAWKTKTVAWEQKVSLWFMKFYIFNRRSVDSFRRLRFWFSLSLSLSLSRARVLNGTKRKWFSGNHSVFGFRASRYVSHRILKRAIVLALNTKGQNTLVHLPARNPSILYQYDKKIPPPPLFNHSFLSFSPSVSCSHPYDSPFLFLILEEWKDSKWRACATGLAEAVSCFSFEKRPWVEANRAEQKRLQGCTCAGVLAPKYFWKNGAADGNEIRKVLGKSAPKTRCREKVRTQDGRGEKAAARKKKKKSRREREKREGEVLRKSEHESEGIYRRNGWSFGRTWRGRR